METQPDDPHLIGNFLKRRLEADTFIKAFFVIFRTLLALVSFLADTDKGLGAITC
jgi:hypothetical protein